MGNTGRTMKFLFIGFFVLLIFFTLIGAPFALGFIVSLITFGFIAYLNSDKRIEDEKRKQEMKEEYRKEYAREKARIAAQRNERFKESLWGSSFSTKKRRK